MSAKRGLGKGLGALLGEPRPAPAAAASPLRELPVSAIVPNPQQPRRTFDEAALEGLRESVAAHGVLVPVMVRAAGDRFELIAGERRWRAAVAAGRVTIPALVCEADDQRSLELAIIENLQRADLNPLEEAVGFADLIETYGFSQERVAERVGRSRPAVANALRLLALCEPVKDELRAGRLSAGHARTLVGLPAREQQALAKLAIDRQLTVRALERLSHRGSGPAKKPPARQTPDQSALLERLRYRYAAPIAVSRRGRGGVVAISFADDEELTRITDLLLGDT